MVRDDLIKLKNLGEKSADMLVNVGITSPQQIEDLGAVAVYKRLREHHHVSRVMLWALQGALMDIPYNQLPDDIKQDLLYELDRID